MIRLKHLGADNQTCTMLIILLYVTYSLMSKNIKTYLKKYSVCSVVVICFNVLRQLCYSLLIPQSQPCHTSFCTCLICSRRSRAWGQFLHASRAWLTWHVSDLHNGVQRSWTEQQPHSSPHLVAAAFWALHGTIVELVPSDRLALGCHTTIMLRPMYASYLPHPATMFFQTWDLLC